MLPGGSSICAPGPLIVKTKGAHHAERRQGSARSAFPIIAPCSPTARTLRAAAQERSGAPRPDGRSASLPWAARGADGVVPSQERRGDERNYNMLRIYTTI